MRRPLVLYDYATKPFWISLYVRKIFFSFYQCASPELRPFIKSAGPSLQCWGSRSGSSRKSIFFPDPGHADLAPGLRHFWLNIWIGIKTLPIHRTTTLLLSTFEGAKQTKIMNYFVNSNKGQIYWTLTKTYFSKKNIRVNVDIFEIFY
jgi:hypothetical protein